MIDQAREADDLPLRIEVQQWRRAPPVERFGNARLPRRPGTATTVTKSCAVVASTWGPVASAVSDTAAHRRRWARMSRSSKRRVSGSERRTGRVQEIKPARAMRGLGREA